MNPPRYLLYLTALLLAFAHPAWAVSASSERLGSAEWLLGPDTAIVAGAVGDDAGAPIGVRSPQHISLDFERALLTADSRGLAFSALLISREADACAKLEISFLDREKRELGRVSSVCGQADGRPRPLALVAQPPPAATAVHFRLLTLLPATVLIDRLRTEQVAIGTPGLRSLVDGPVMEALDNGLIEIRRRAMNRSQVEWDFIAAQATADAVHAHRTRELLPGISLVLKALGDGHSWATVLDDGGRMKIGSAAKPPPFVLPDHRSQVPAGERPVVLLRMTPLGSVSPDDADAYAAATRQALDDGVRGGACAYVIDLRAHTGGNMWPGLAGLGPLLGPRAVGAFKPGPEWVVTKDGVTLGGQLAASATQPGLSLDRLEDAPVALLLGPRTASSGEAIGIAFAGRANTRSFGSKTRGLTTVNQMVNLGDGLRAFVTNGVMLDRNGNSYPTGLHPDVEVNSQDDAEVTAFSWARSFGACATKN